MSRPRILLIEDSRSQAIGIRNELQSGGFDVDVAFDGLTGLQRVNESHFDLVLTDVVMPGISGYEVCRRLKEQSAHKDTPVVLLTSLNEPTDIVQGLECGADNFITKPFKPTQLKSRIRNILLNRSTRADERINVALEVSLLGKRVKITSDREQILDLLISSFEELLRTRQREDESRQAQEVLKRSHQFLQSTLNALSAHIAVLDQEGAVIAVNAAPKRFARLTEFFGAHCSIGTNYFEFCKSANSSHRERIGAVAAGVREVLAAERDDFYAEIPFCTCNEECWFQVNVTRIDGAGPGRVVVAHEDITERRLAEEGLRRSREQLRHSREETILRLARAGECRDDDTGRHVQRMSRYCALLAERIGLDRERCELIRLASILHDVGKIGIEDRILLKRGALTADEFEIMKKHVDIGQQILAGSDSELLQIAALIAWTHHEKYDGTGYPRGLAGEAIQLEGRIAAIADVFDALSSNRVYRPAFPLQRCVSIMRENRGKHFDPNLLDQFLNSLDQALRIRRQYSDDPVADQPAFTMPLLECFTPAR